MYLRVIACEAICREVCHLAARSANVIDLQFLDMAAHNEPKGGRKTIQQALDATPANRYDAVLLGYGLCGQIADGLRTRRHKVVIPRAHDCIGLLLGSRARRAAELAQAPGTYFYSAGWLDGRKRARRRAQAPESASLPAFAAYGFAEAYEGWVRKYGPERAQILLEEANAWRAGYQRGVWIDFDFLRPLGMEKEVRAICEREGWRFETLPGDLGLLERWLEGRWNQQEFLTAPPGTRIAATYDDRVIDSVPEEGE